ncbi:FAD/NAD(P)-binding domain-containing protein [Mytilinidion resinicola]|uniref:FAD/NAD(P)-binding domain-containing protein n=1 Tax=Mytilinidion resinicola TaxID=574789 RepID=A0A6A6YE46_9PEZI|nr:FAD/NAD(P)-binding domain-containing protein [Mytilinidion resinicola]KAF2807086.1 FAD/NAD(P)-binding domain-containing protein [Mytilinidion resinicola]
MSASKMKILISGAGIAGPCLAYWLARTHLNAAVTVMERSPTPRVTGQSIDIRGPAIEIMKRMNLEEAVRSRNTTEEGTIILNASGKPFAHFEGGDKGGDTFTAEYEILRADLVGLFLDATESLSNVKYLYGDSIKSLDQTEKTVKVTFAGGSSDTFDLVVAADGGISKTRDMILDEHITKNCYNFLGQYIAFFSIPSRPTDPKMWQWYNRPNGLCVMLRPHRNPATVGAYLCITTPARGQQDPAVEAALDEGVEAQKRILHEYLGNLGWETKRVLEGMDSAEDFYMSRAAQVKLPKWTNGRALVLGDAAHATFGVGTTLAIESAYILAGELSKIQSSEDIPRALERFEEVYRPLYTKSEGLPPFFPQFTFPQTSWVLWIRDSLLWFISKTKLYKLLPADEGSGLELPSYGWVDIHRKDE